MLQFLRPAVALAVLLTCSTSMAAGAPTDAGELARLRADMETMRHDYDARITALQSRLASLESGATASSPPQTDPSRADNALVDAPLAPSTGDEATASSTPAPRVAAGGSNAFNPDIGLTLQGQYAGERHAPTQPSIRGFQLGGDAGAGARGLALGETELSLSANIDDRFYGFANLAFVKDGGESKVEVEEVYLQTTTLPSGLTVRAGQFFSNVGYQNSRHSHVWDFVDQPLAYTALLNSQYLDPGARVSWLAPLPFYAEIGAEVFRGDAFPGGGSARDGVGATSLYAKFGGDIGDSSAWQTGLGWLSMRPRARQYQADDGEVTEFSGDSDVVIADALWKWSPNGNFHDTNLVLQAEWLHRKENGRLDLLSGESAGRGAYHGTQDGWYVQGVYQFMPRWRAGLRYDALHADNQVTGFDVPTVLTDGGTTPRRVSGMFDFSNSEFSRFRLQFERDDSSRRAADRYFLQYIVSLGAHGAHTF